MVSESDISVQGHGVHTAYKEIAAALEKRSDVEVIRGRFDEVIPCEVIHLHTIGTKALAKLSQHGPVKVVSAHVVPDSLVGSIRLAKYWLPLARWYMKWFYNRADKLLAVSGTVANTLHDELKVPKEKIETFYNTITMERYARTLGSRSVARRELKIDDSTFVVLGNGQVQPRKRLDTFVAMAKALPDIRFIWVGGIPFKRLGAGYAQMQQLMENLPSNMSITGVIDHAEVKKYYDVADVFCLPAEQENHPMCVLEAAGSELPIILRDIPEYDDTFGEDAIRCLSDEDFIAAVRQLHDDREFYNQQCEASVRIKRQFDSAAAAERLEGIYRKLLAR